MSPDEHRAALVAAYRSATSPEDWSAPCRLCGSVPAVDVQFRWHIGKAVTRRTRRATGPFCRECGLTVFRDYTARTLITGWWELASIFITPYILLSNLSRSRLVDRLVPPNFPASGRAPLRPGRPVYRRWQIVGLGVPLVIVAVIAAAVSAALLSTGTGDHLDRSLVGACVVEYPLGIVDCSVPHDGEIIDVVASEHECPPATDFVLISPYTTGYSCVMRT